MTKPHIFTIGYEKAAQGDVIAALHDAGVTQLVDVRARPLSRRPGFSKKALAGALEEEGIAYIGLPALGTPPDGRAAALDHRLSDLKRVYSAQLDTPEAIVAAEQLKELVAEKPTALLCYERDPTFCHRTQLREAVLKDYPFTNLYP